MSHKRLNLMADVDTPDTDPMRPNLSVWYDKEDYAVTILVGPAWGSQQRYINMTPYEARKLAVFLTQAADEAAQELAQEKANDAWAQRTFKEG